MPHMSSFITVLAVILGVVPISIVDAQAPPDYQGQINTANSRIDAVNQIASQNSQRITAANTNINRVEANMNNNFAYYDNLINAIVTNFTAVQAEQEAKLNFALGQIEELGTAIQGANDQIDKLQSVNKIWQKNFQVVNKTFAELRRKVKFVVPGGVPLALLPVNYGVRPRPKPRGR